MTVEEAIAAFRSNPTLLRLQGVAQHYDWGGFDFIPELLRTPNPERQPFAELWIGAHPSAPAIASIGAARIALDHLFESVGDLLLGPAAKRFSGQLPYLLKILDARKMLSIQAHPTKQQAREGFARESAAGIKLNAPERSYRDENHKPEVHVGLGEFWMLHGFRPLEEIASILKAVPELDIVMPAFEERLETVGGEDLARKALLRDLYSRLMSISQDRVDAFLNPLLVRLRSGETPPKESPDFWALRAAEDFPLPGGHRDRGIFSIYLLNLVHLKAGEGSYQPAGMLHAYLEGANVELMANSDNVLRGGLTPKHVDVPELMRTLTFESGKPEILRGESLSPAETVYPTPNDEFRLSRITLAPSHPYDSPTDHGADSLVVIEGAASAVSRAQRLELTRGDIILAPYGVPYHLETASAPATLYRATIPPP